MPKLKNSAISMWEQSGGNKQENQQPVGKRKFKFEVNANSEVDVGIGAKVVSVKSIKKNAMPPNDYDRSSTNKDENNEKKIPGKIVLQPEVAEKLNRVAGNLGGRKNSSNETGKEKPASTNVFDSENAKQVSANGDVGTAAAAESISIKERAATLERQLRGKNEQAKTVENDQNLNSTDEKANSLLLEFKTISRPNVGKRRLPSKKNKNVGKDVSDTNNVGLESNVSKVLPASSNIENIALNSVTSHLFSDSVKNPSNINSNASSNSIQKSIATDEKSNGTPPHDASLLNSELTKVVQNKVSDFSDGKYKNLNKETSKILRSESGSSSDGSLEKREPKKKKNRGWKSIINMDAKKEPWFGTQ